MSYTYLKNLIIVWRPVQGVWTPSLTFTDPSVPYLPLEDAPAAAAAPFIPVHWTSRQAGPAAGRADLGQNLLLALLAATPAASPFVTRAWDARIVTPRRIQDLSRLALTLGPPPTQYLTRGATQARLLVRPRAAELAANHLLLNTLAAVAPSPFVPAEWAARIKLSVRSQTPDQNLLLNTLAAVAASPFIPREWAARIRLLVRSQTPDQNLLLGTLAAAAASPFVPAEWASRIVALRRRPDLSPLPLTLGPGPIESLARGATQGRLFVRPRAAELAANNLLLNTLAAAAASPFVPAEWAARIQRVIRSQPLDQNLQLNTLAAAPATPVVPVAWQSRAAWPAVPRIAGPMAELAQNLLLTTLAPPSATPFRPAEWPARVPRQARQELPLVNLLTATLFTPPAAPFVPMEWISRITIPIRRQEQGQNLLATTLAAAPASPFASTDWPATRQLRAMTTELLVNQLVTSLLQSAAPLALTVVCVRLHVSARLWNALSMTYRTGALLHAAKTADRDVIITLKTDAILHTRDTVSRVINLKRC